MHSLITTSSLTLSLCFLLLLTSSVQSAQAAGTTIVITEQPTSTAPSSSYTSAAQFESDMLAAHNFYRQEHNVTTLEWNDTSASFAASWSSRCQFEHSGGPTGENLASGYPNASASVDAWGLEREKYNWGHPGFSEATGHFTQLVWSNTTSVGCGVANCGASSSAPGFFVVCEYYPQGNVVGDNNQYFVYNVKKQIEGKSTDTIESGVTAGGSRLYDISCALTLLAAASTVAVGMTW